MKKSLLLGVFFVTVFLQLSFGQNFSADRKNELNIADPGVDFIVAGGIYMGSPKTALYYSGYPENELNLNYIFGNEYRKKEIIKLITDKNSFVSSTDTTIGIRDYPEKVHYQPAMSVCLGASYRFDEHWRINIYYTFARLVVKSVFHVKYDNRVPGNIDRPEFLDYLLMGKENRSFFDLTGSYTFQFNKIFKPFIEVGAQFNYVKVKSLDAVIEDREFSLFDRYGGASYVPGMEEYKVTYGGAGFGVTGVIGAKLAFSKSVSVDPCFYVSFGKIGLTDYKDFHLNWGAYIRLVLSDAMFQR